MRDTLAPLHVARITQTAVIAQDRELQVIDEYGMLCAMTWYPLETVESSIFTNAPHVIRTEIELPVPPARVWESLQSDESLAAWGPGIKSVRWQTPRPFGAGTTREVTLALSAVTVHERFFAWTEGYQASFYVYEMNRPMIRRFAEDYVLTERPGGALLSWTVALEAHPKYRRLIALNVPIVKLACALTARDAKRYFAKHP